MQMMMLSYHLRIASMNNAATQARNDSQIARRSIGKTGIQVTELGFGGLQMGDYWVKISEEEAYDTIRAAHDAGVTYFDTAPQYGNGLSEHRLGHALRGLPRDSFVISTKAGRYLEPDNDAAADPNHRGLPFRRVYDPTYDSTMRGVEQSLHRLGLSRIDMIFIHDLDTHELGEDYERVFRIGVEGCFRALDELRSQGVIGAVGAGLNVSEAAIRLIGETDLDCLMIAGRYTLLEQGPASELLPLAADKGVTLLMGAPFNTGILATGAVDGARYNNKLAGAEVLERVHRIETVCARYDLPIAAVALQFGLGDPNCASIVPGMGGHGDVARNLDLMKVAVPSDSWADLRNEGLLDEAVPIEGLRSRA